MNSVDLACVKAGAEQSSFWRAGVSLVFNLLHWLLSDLSCEAHTCSRFSQVLFSGSVFMQSLSESSSAVNSVGVTCVKARAEQSSC